MNMGWTRVAFDAAGDWHVWLTLTGVLVLYWGPSLSPRGRYSAQRAVAKIAESSPPIWVVCGDKPGQDESRQGRAD